MSFITTKDVSDTPHGRVIGSKLVTRLREAGHESVPNGTPAHLEPAGRDGSLTAAQVSPRPERFGGAALEAAHHRVNGGMICSRIDI